jgi:AraC-like DNA-binding protein
MREADAPDPSGRIFFFPAGALFVGEGLVNEPHRHFTASISFALTGPLRVKTRSRDWWQTQGVAFAPNVEQAMDAPSGTVVILQIDPETEDYRRIAALFESSRVCELDEALCEKLVDRARPELDGGIPDPRRLWQSIVGALAVPGREAPRRDPRIDEMLKILKSCYLDPPPAAALARQVGLSEVRVVHLFSQQMGLPMRRYLLWLRLRSVIYSLALGQTLTEAAHAAGFADSAHMSRTFRGMFGLAPSLLLKQNRKLSIEFVLPSSSDEAGPHYEFDLVRLQEIQRTQADRKNRGA